MILGANSGLGGGIHVAKKDERRYELPNSSGGSSLLEIGRGNRVENIFRTGYGGGIGERQLNTGNQLDRIHQG